MPTAENRVNLCFDPTEAYKIFILTLQFKGEPLLVQQERQENATPKRSDREINSALFSLSREGNFGHFYFNKSTPTAKPK